jgi:uncharacterized protein (TIGR00251 family)
MRISVKVQPKSSREALERLEDGSYKARVHAPPADGEANAAVVELVAKHFGKPKSAVKIVAGHTSRTKILEIE